MTRRTFYKKLERAMKELDATPDRGFGGSYRCYVKGKSHAESAHPFCPITLVYFHETGKRMVSYAYRHAAYELGLHFDDALAIAYAADNIKGADRRVKKALFTRIFR